MSAIQIPQVIVDPPAHAREGATRVRGYAPLVRHRRRHMNIAPSIPAPRVLADEDLFTKHERCYHHGRRGSQWKGRVEEGNIVEQAMNEVLKNDKYIGFSHNTKEDSVYLIKSRVWDGIDSESIGCERRPVPQGLTQKTSQKWKWHSLYIKK
jgi:hypothetical protein